MPLPYIDWPGGKFPPSRELQTREKFTVSRAANLCWLEPDSRKFAGRPLAFCPFDGAREKTASAERRRRRRRRSGRRRRGEVDEDERERNEAEGGERKN